MISTRSCCQTPTHEKNNLDKASEIVEDMEVSGVMPDRVTYNTLLSFSRSKGDFTQAQRILKKIMNDGLTPSIVTYGALINAYCSNDNLDAAMQIFRELSSSSKIPPNTVNYIMLLIFIIFGINLYHGRQ